MSTAPKENRIDIALNPESYGVLQKTAKDLDVSQSGLFAAVLLYVPQKTLANAVEQYKADIELSKAKSKELKRQMAEKLGGSLTKEEIALILQAHQRA